MNAPVKVSVAMITYNHERYIRQAVESVLMQETDFPIEIVIGDDCSTDETSVILAELQRQHPEMIRLLPRDRNLGMNRNFADVFLNCQGTYVALLEGDDYWTHSRKLQKQVDALDAHPDWAICFHTTRFFHEDNSHPPFYFPQDFSQEVSTLDDLLKRNFIQTCSVMYRNGLIENIPNWFVDLKLGDWPLHVLHAQHGKIGFLRDVMSDYRIHSSGFWSAHSDEFRRKAIVEMYIHFACHLGLQYSHQIAAGILEGETALQSALSDMRHSLSWRITAPIRWAARALVARFNPSTR